MSTLCRHLDAYLKLRRQLGFKLELAGPMLRHFVRYADQKKAAFVTVKLALRWATQPVGLTQTRNATRLGYVRGFARYLSAYDPRTEIPPVGLIPGQFCRRTPHLYQDHDIVRLLDATRHIDDRNEFKGMAYATLLGLLAVTGLRIGEGTAAHVRCTGKGRKTRCIPLRKEVVAALRVWVREQNAQPVAALFPSARGIPMSRDGVEYLLAKHVAMARISCSTLKAKRVTPHVLRHTTAMDLLQHGVDRSVIALWLGHESMESTQVYLHASLELKQRALAKVEPFTGQSSRYRPPNQVLAFLQSL